MECCVPNCPVRPIRPVQRADGSDIELMRCGRSCRRETKNCQQGDEYSAEESMRWRHSARRYENYTDSYATQTAVSEANMSRMSQRSIPANMSAGENLNWCPSKESAIKAGLTLRNRRRNHVSSVRQLHDRVSDRKLMMDKVI